MRSVWLRYVWKASVHMLKVCFKILPTGVGNKRGEVSLAVQNILSAIYIQLYSAAKCSFSELSLINHFNISNLLKKEKNQRRRFHKKVSSMQHWGCEVYSVVEITCRTFSSIRIIFRNLLVDLRVSSAVSDVSTILTYPQKTVFVNSSNQDKL